MQIDKLLLATGNPNKRREIEPLVRPLGIAVVTLADVGDIGEVVEDGDTFEANACKKALYGAAKTGLWCLADDSGLEVDALDGAPGVYSARYAGEDADDEANNRKLLDALADVPEDERAARFRCAIALAAPEGGGGACVVFTTEGAVEGRILREERGANGFGYDPLFFHPPSGVAFAELSMEEKSKVSHRGKALAAFVGRLRDMMQDKAERT